MTKKLRFGWLELSEVMNFWNRERIFCIVPPTQILPDRTSYKISWCFPKDMFSRSQNYPMLRWSNWPLQWNYWLQCLRNNTNPIPRRFILGSTLVRISWVNCMNLQWTVKPSVNILYTYVGILYTLNEQTEMFVCVF